MGVSLFAIKTVQMSSHKLDASPTTVSSTLSVAYASGFHFAASCPVQVEPPSELLGAVARMQQRVEVLQPPQKLQQSHRG